MHTEKSGFKGLLLFIVLMSLIMGVRFFDLIQAPNSQLINNGPDAYRSYMAAMYHVKHDSTYLHYEGMNYPYGDRIDYTDSLPILTIPIKFISRHFVDLYPYLIGIWNIFLLLSILFGGIFVFLIFRELKLPDWYAILVAIGIACLSPQLLRFHAHYGLAHPFVIPMMIYLLLKFEKKPSWKFSLLIGLVLILIFGFHSYLFVNAILLVGFYWLFDLLRNFTWDNFKRVLWNGGLQTILPFVILGILIFISDGITDRPDKPWGFFVYRAYWSSVFFPVESFVGQLFKSIAGPMQYIQYEGLVYVGAIASLFSLGVVLKKLRHPFKGKILEYASPAFRPAMLNFLGASIVFLALSFGYPFSLSGLEEYLNYTGPYQQFRSVGRFAWVFYYIINITAFYVGYRWVSTFKREDIRMAVLVIAIGVLNFEAITYFFNPHYQLYPHPAIRSKLKMEDTPWMNTIDWSDYQAILPIPYFHNGSENIWVDPVAPVLQGSMWTSVQTGLPIISSFMGRTSISQTINLINLVTEPYRPSPALDLLKPDKSILVYVQKTNIKNRENDFNYLYEGLASLYENEDIVLYELPVSVIQERIPQMAQKAKAAFNTIKLYPKGDAWTTDSLAQFVYQSFDETSVEREYAGTGAFAGESKKEHFLYDGPLYSLADNTPFTFTSWIYIGEDLHARTWLSLEEYDIESGARIHQQSYQLFRSIRAIDEGWALIQIPFVARKAKSNIRVMMINHDLFKESFYADELLIFPSQTDVYRQTAPGLWKNNRFYQ